MKRHTAGERTLEEFDAWSAVTDREEAVAKAADGEGGPRLSLVPPILRTGRGRLSPTCPKTRPMPPPSSGAWPVRPLGPFATRAAARSSNRPASAGRGVHGAEIHFDVRWIKFGIFTPCAAPGPESRTPGDGIRSGADGRGDRHGRETGLSGSNEEGGTPSRLIDARIAAPGDWRGEALRQVRALIRAADPEVVETVKWKKPSNPAGVPVWEHDGIICTGETYRDKVKLTFARGAALPDPAGLFNASLEGNTRRAIDIREGETIDGEALKALVRAAVAANVARRA